MHRSRISALLSFISGSTGRLRFTYNLLLLLLLDSLDALLVVHTLRQLRALRRRQVVPSTSLIASKKYFGHPPSLFSNSASSRNKSFF